MDARLASVHKPRRPRAVRGGLRRISVLLAVLAASPAGAADVAPEPVRATAPPPPVRVERMHSFVAGLRERQFYDAAVIYLDRAAADPRTPAEFQDVIPLEKALTLLAEANTVRNPEVRLQKLEQAEALLEQFTRAQPAHSRAAQANSEWGRILLDKARAATWQSRSPANAGRRDEFRNEARHLIGRARARLQTAHDQFRAAWEQFPAFIDEQRDRGRFNERRLAEIAWIRAQLDLALCTYEEAQTHESGSPEHSGRLAKASAEFEAIHQRYRSMVGGLYARMWQGKCFEEQDEIRKALGVYDELLRHPGSSDAMKALQDQVRQFRLSCLNHDQRRDYQLAIQEAGAWLSENRHRSGTQVGLGIRWERARAAELQSQRGELTREEKDALLRQAMADAREINRHPGSYKDASTYMIQRLNVQLSLGDGDPEDFSAALGLGRVLVKDLGTLRQQIDESTRAGRPEEETAELRKEYDVHLNEARRILRLALDLADPQTDENAMWQARYLLAYVCYLSGRNEEAALLGEYVARHRRPAESQLALDAAFLALAAWRQAYDAAPHDAQEFEVGRLEHVAGFLVEFWPNSGRADEARMALGAVHAQRKQPGEAARWFASIPASSSHFASAQLAAGQAYWRARLEAARLPDQANASDADLAAWRQAARRHLRAGVERMRRALVPEEPAPDELLAAKVSLAQIALDEDRPDEAVEWLTAAPHAVVVAIAAPDEAERHDEGIRSRRFAQLVHRLLARARLAQAQAAMERLEAASDEPLNAGWREAFDALFRTLDDGQHQPSDAD